MEDILRAQFTTLIATFWNFVHYLQFRNLASRFLYMLFCNSTTDPERNSSDKKRVIMMKILMWQNQNLEANTTIPVCGFPFIHKFSEIWMSVNRIFCSFRGISTRKRDSPNYSWIVFYFDLVRKMVACYWRFEHRNFEIRRHLLSFHLNLVYPRSSASSPLPSEREKVNWVCTYL